MQIVGPTAVAVAAPVAQPTVRCVALNLDTGLMTLAYGSPAPGAPSLIAQVTLSSAVLAQVHAAVQAGINKAQGWSSSTITVAAAAPPANTAPTGPSQVKSSA